MKSDNIIEFHQPNNPPSVLSDLILQAQDAAHFSFHATLEQLEAVKAANRLERNGDLKQAADLRGIAESKAAACVHLFLESLLALRRVQEITAGCMDEAFGHGGPLLEELKWHAAAVFQWTAEQRAEELLDSCRTVAARLKAECPEKMAGKELEPVDLSLFARTSLLTDARIHGADLQWLGHAAFLMQPAA
ncbi:MAG: hypothetical protein V4726_24420 [Verrucomicrobiota bacterium]